MARRVAISKAPTLTWRKSVIWLRRHRTRLPGCNCSKWVAQNTLNLLLTDNTPISMSRLTQRRERLSVVVLVGCVSMYPLSCLYYPTLSCKLYDMCHGDANRLWRPNKLCFDHHHQNQWLLKVWLLMMISLWTMPEQQTVPALS
jgi:hypothetical protein